MRTGRRALLAVALALAGCGGESTNPLPGRSGLSGGWTFSYVAVDTTAPCPPAPGLVSGCSGGGTLEFVEVGPQASGSWTARGGCQSCGGGAADYFGSGSLSPRVSSTTLEFALQDCAFRAVRPRGAFDDLSGTVRCAWGPVSYAGTWRMTRSP